MTRRKRRLSPNALTALEVITDFKVRRIRLHDFTLAMSQRGLSQPACNSALAGFARRGWMIVEASHLVMTDDGWLAATNGMGATVVNRRRSGRSGNRRMPTGLF